MRVLYSAGIFAGSGAERVIPKNEDRHEAWKE
jgi:hypothetical protein